MMPMDNASWAARDLSVIWHPCTQMQDHERRPLIPIRRGQGIWLEDFEGRRYLDAISSWWVNLFGHACPEISGAIAAQAAVLEHVLLAGFTHEPAIRLSETLVRLAPSGLSRCFYGDSGSAAVEIALKMSVHYWRNMGRPQKTRMVSLEGAYHGETLGALALGDLGLYRSAYDPILNQWSRAPAPVIPTRPSGMSETEHVERCLAAMAERLAQEAGTTAAVIVEPLVQCAGGMRMYPAAYLRGLRSLCDEHEVHLIVDEVAVGFGRTGTMFACEQASLSPDFLCLGKGLTGGYLPLSACLTHDRVYQAFYGGGSERAFLHSHSFTGSALGCAAALATLDLFEQRGTIAANQALARQLEQQSRELLEPQRHVAHLRQTGLICAFELMADPLCAVAYAPGERRGWQVAERALSQGVLIRPLGDTLYLMPPYVISAEEIRWLVEVVATAVDQVTG